VERIKLLESNISVPTTLGAIPPELEGRADCGVAVGDGGIDDVVVPETKFLQ